MTLIIRCFILDHKFHMLLFKVRRRLVEYLNRNGISKNVQFWFHSSYATLTSATFSSIARLSNSITALSPHSIVILKKKRNITSSPRNEHSFVAIFLLLLVWSFWIFLLSFDVQLLTEHFQAFLNVAEIFMFLADVNTKAFQKICQRTCDRAKLIKNDAPVCVHGMNLPSLTCVPLTKMYDRINSSNDSRRRSHSFHCNNDSDDLSLKQMYCLLLPLAELSSWNIIPYTCNQPQCTYHNWVTIAFPFLHSPFSNESERPIKSLWIFCRFRCNTPSPVQPVWLAILRPHDWVWISPYSLCIEYSPRSSETTARTGIGLICETDSNRSSLSYHRDFQIETLDFSDSAGFVDRVDSFGVSDSCWLDTSVL